MRWSQAMCTETRNQSLFFGLTCDFWCISQEINEVGFLVYLLCKGSAKVLLNKLQENNIRGQFHTAAKQATLLSNIKQTTSQNEYILYERLSGNPKIQLSKLFCSAILSA